MDRDLPHHLWAILGLLVAVAMIPAAALIPAAWAVIWVMCWLAAAAIMLFVILALVFPARHRMLALIALGLSCAGVAASAYWYATTNAAGHVVPNIPPEIEALRNSFRMRGPVVLLTRPSPDGTRMIEAVVGLNLTNAGPAAMSYTVHRFRGQIEGVEMPDVPEPNYGGEKLINEEFTYAGGVAHVDIGAGPFNGEVEWDIRYGIPGNEPFKFARRATFSGIWNPQTRRAESVRFTWRNASPNAQQE